MNIELIIHILEAVMLVGIGVVLVVLVKVVNMLNESMSQCESLSISMDNRLYDLGDTADRLDRLAKTRSNNTIAEAIAENLRARLNQRIRIEPMDGEAPLDFPNDRK